MERNILDEILKRKKEREQEPMEKNVQRKIEEMKFWGFFDNNFVYCEETHSFIHRLFDKSKEKEWESYHDAQHDAFQVIKEMREEFDRRKDSTSEVR